MSKGGWFSRLFGGEESSEYRKQKDQGKKAIDAGHDLSRVLATDDLVTSDNAFFAATGITDGELLKGVRFHAEGATTQTLVMRSKSGTIRFMESDHRLGKLRKYAAVQF